ncbi:reticulon-4-interacting protein 1 homolog, mitochondrial-like [Anneissia japonica]|uniref:reticulon-4-interacting protein 1 homolog, mitochondrial-like n=1 Tax=Anneissia japonica TaxID=1529436 RepID=UPI00142594B0|nr:reticulon-4-interacting protein 1 homolog, mitochondrial-like [Anneissia japonica]
MIKRITIVRRLSTFPIVTRIQDVFMQGQYNKRLLHGHGGDAASASARCLAIARKDRPRLSYYRRLCKINSPLIQNVRHFNCTTLVCAESNIHPGEIRTSMFAWQIHNYGKDNLNLVEKLVPVITKPKELLIKVYASSINPIDLRMQGGYGAVLLNKGRRCSSGDEFPLILGRDCSGVVVDVGKGVMGIKKGDEVWAAVSQIKPGCHAQYVLINEDEVSKKPESLTHVQAASLPYVISTVWSALYAIARFRPKKESIGKSVLIHGGSGGVGSFAIQLVKAWNGKVSTTCSTSAVDMVKKLGANHVYDYKQSDFQNSLLKAGGFDLILDTIGGPTEDLSMELLKSGSQLISLVSPFMADMDRYGAVVGSLSASTTMFKKAMAVSRKGGKYRWAFATPNAVALETIAQLVDEGKIRPVIDRVFTFKQIPEAFEKLEKGHARGKIVIDMGEEKITPTSSDFYMNAANN